MIVFEICAIVYVAIQIVWLIVKLRSDRYILEWYREANYKLWIDNECLRKIGPEEIFRRSKRNAKLDTLRTDSQIRDFESLKYRKETQ